MLAYSAQRSSLGMEIYVVDVESQVAGYPTIQQRFSSTVAWKNSTLWTKYTDARDYKNGVKVNTFLAQTVES